MSAVPIIIDAELSRTDISPANRLRAAAANTAVATRIANEHTDSVEDLRICLTSEPMTPDQQAWITKLLAHLT